MGLRFSSASPNPHTAKVVAADGSLSEFSVFVTVSDVLGSHYASSILCNSDSLTYNSHIPVLHLDEPLQPGQLYFILPVEILGSPLTGPDMAALAAKAISALKYAKVNRRCRLQRKFQVLPIGADSEFEGIVEVNAEMNRVYRPRPAQRRVGRTAPSRVGAAQFSSRVELSTIEEIAWAKIE